MRPCWARGGRRFLPGFFSGADTTFTGVERVVSSFIRGRSAACGPQEAVTGTFIAAWVWRRRCAGTALLVSQGLLCSLYAE